MDITFPSYETLATSLRYLFKSWGRLRAERAVALDEIANTFGDPQFLARWYVEPDCQRHNPANVDEEDPLHRHRSPIWKSLASFLAQESPSQLGRNHLFILSDAGMGKTSLLVMLKLTHLSQVWPSRLEFVLKKIGPTTLSELEGITSRRNTVLLLDALDEYREAWGNVPEYLEKLLRATSNFRRVVISCRTQFFGPTVHPEAHADDVLVGPFQCALEYISPFSDAQVLEFLHKVYPNGFLRRLLSPLRLVAKDNARLRDAKELILPMKSLCCRPMLLSHIKELTGELDEQRAKAPERWDEFTLYRALMQQWLLREQRKMSVDGAELRNACTVLAIELSRNRVRELNAEAFDRLCEKHRLVRTVSRTELKGRSLLNTNSKGEYRFSHYSIQEFLAVEAALEMPRTERAALADVVVTAQMLRFAQAWIDGPPLERGSWGAAPRQHNLAELADEAVAARHGLWIRSRIEGAKCGDDRIEASLAEPNGVPSPAELGLKCLPRLTCRNVNLENSDLRGACLSNAELCGGRFALADLTDSNLEGADLSNVDFAGATLTGARLHGALLTGANFDGAKLDGIEPLEVRNQLRSFGDPVEVEAALSAWFQTQRKRSRTNGTSESRLNNALLHLAVALWRRGGTLQRDQVKACIAGTDLEVEDLCGRDSPLVWVDSGLRMFSAVALAYLLGAACMAGLVEYSADMGAMVQRWILRFLRERETSFGLSFDLVDCRIPNLDLVGVDLKGCCLDGVNFEKARLSRANLGKASLRGARLDGAQLDGAILNEAVLTQASLRSANLEGATCMGADFTGADVAWARLDGVEVSNSTWARAELTNVRVAKASIDTLMPWLECSSGIGLEVLEEHDLVHVPAGTSDDGVWVGGFWVSRHAVAASDYRLFASEQAGAPCDRASGGKAVRGSAKVSVDWGSAVDYCCWLSRKLNKHARLPTLYEWKRAYACGCVDTSSASQEWCEDDWHEKPRPSAGTVVLNPRHTGKAPRDMVCVAWVPHRKVVSWGYERQHAATILGFRFVICRSRIFTNTLQECSSPRV